MKISLSCLLASFCLAACVTVAYADDLPRHGVIGLVVGARDLNEPEDPASNPPTVKKVLPGSAGESAHIQPGDELVSVDEQPVTSSTQFALMVTRHLGGDSVHVKLLRGGEPHTLTVTLKPRPFETSPDAELVYTSVTVDGSRRRVILTHPRAAGRYPVVLLMGGLGCYSLDGALSAKEGYGAILAFLAKNDFVTARVEKTGEGDSEGPACTDPAATAEREAHGYVSVMQLLKQSDFVDATNIFVFAHSLGPLIGAMVLPQLPIRGFIAAETIGRSWFEYSVENVRRQSILVGESYDRVDEETRNHTNCAFHFYMLHESAEQVGKLGSQCVDMLHSSGGVPAPYMQQVGDIHLAEQWKQVDLPVLVIYGTSDPVTSAGESHYLVDMINSFHAGQATYVEVAKMGHDFAVYDSPAAFLNGVRRKEPHPFNDQVLPVLLTWLRQHQQPAG